MEIKEEYNPKHSPVIEIKKKNGIYKIIIEVGKEKEHPNDFNHNICWLDLFFKPEGKEIVHLARIDFKAHGENNCFTKPKVVIYTKLEGKGKLIALSYCNLHGVWKTEQEI